MEALPSILMVADSLQLGGAERHVVALAGRLALRGYRVRIACSAGGVFLHDPALRDVRVVVLGDELVKRRVSAKFADGIAAEIQRSPTDLVHAHMFASAAAAASALGSRDLAFVVTEHTEAVWRTPADVATSREVYARSHAVIAVSTAIRERLIHGDDVAQERVHLVLNGIEPPVGRRGGPFEAAGPTI